MKTIVRFSFIAVIVGAATLLASCSNSLTDIGYKTYYLNRSSGFYNNAPNIGLFTPTPLGFSRVENIASYPTHSSDSYHRYAYVSDIDLGMLYLSHIQFRMIALRELYAAMNEADFYLPAFNNTFGPLLAPNVDRFMQEASDTADSPLGKWQVLKPSVGLDAAQGTYDIKYLGNDWFSVAPAGDTVSVRVRVALASKDLLPVIIEASNHTLGIASGPAPDGDAGPGFMPQSDFVWTQPAHSNYQRTDDYWDFIAQTLRRTSLSPTTKRNYVTEADFNHMGLRMVNTRLQLLSRLYETIATPTDRHALSQLYKWVTLPIEQTMPRGSRKWEVFSPQADGKPDITYMGNDWFHVKGDTTDLYIQFVLNDRKMRPQIIGLRNPSRDIMIAQNLCTDQRHDNFFFTAH